MLDTEIGNIDTELDNVKSSGAAISTAQTNGANTKTKIDLIPSNSAGNGVADWTYAAPINANPTSGTITSTFPSELGSINDADAGTYIHNAYHEVDVSLDVINSVASAADSFGNSIATFQGAVSGVQGTVGDFATFLEDIDSTFYQYYNVGKPIFSALTSVMTAFFGVVVALSILGILGTILMTFCGKDKCRYLIYFSCSVLTIIGIVCFLLATVMSFIVPTFYYTC